MAVPKRTQTRMHFYIYVCDHRLFSQKKKDVVVMLHYVSYHSDYPCLRTFWHCHPYFPLQFLQFFFTLFFFVIFKSRQIELH